MYKQFDRQRIKSRSLAERVNRFSIKDFYQLDSKIPKYENPDLDILAEEIINARLKRQPVVWMMGAHPIRRGNSRFIIDLIRNGIITHIAVNGAVAIHDSELAMIGATCEDVERYIQNGQFGNWHETSLLINSAAKTACEKEAGFGQILGTAIYLSGESFPHRDVSVFAAAYEFMIPITIHKTIGTDITDQHPSADYAALGCASGIDFLIFVNAIEELVRKGGIFLNFGSAVTGPEVFLKALSMARNVLVSEEKKMQPFVTANFDIVKIHKWDGRDTKQGYYYRPQKTILERSVKDGGKSFHIQGDFKVTIPSLYKKLLGGG